MSRCRKSAGLTVALFASWIFVIPDGAAQSPLRTCDAGEKKLSFAVYFRDSWTGSVSSKAGAKADFAFGDRSLEVFVRASSGDPSDVRARLHNMLEMPLMGGEKYRLCFSVQTTKPVTVIGKFIKTIPPEVGQPLQIPESCVFEIERGDSDQSCEFLAPETTESDEFVFFLGKAEPGTQIKFMNLMLYILK